MYSLFHRKSARSATWKCGDPTHSATRSKSGTMISWNSVCCTISKISSTSFRKSTYRAQGQGSRLGLSVTATSALRAAHEDRRRWFTQALTVATVAAPLAYLLSREGPRPVLQDMQKHLLCELRVFLDKLGHAIG